MRCSKKKTAVSSLARVCNQLWGCGWQIHAWSSIFFLYTFVRDIFRTVAQPNALSPSSPLPAFHNSISSQNELEEEEEDRAAFEKNLSGVSCKKTEPCDCRWIN